MPLKKIAVGFLIAAMTQFALAKDLATLTVGEQNYYNIQASMEASGALKDLPYKIEWKRFQAAAPIAESLNSGVLDLGFLGDSGLLTMAARGAPVKVVATSRQNLDGLAIQVAKNSSIRNLRDLKGKTVAVWRGAWSQQLILRALEQAGLPADYVKYSYLMPIDAMAALASGAVDAVSLWEPYVSTLELRQQARTIVTARGLMPALSFVAAHEKAAGDKHVEIQDFLKRLVLARHWVDTHVDEYADLWAKRANIDRDVAYRWLNSAHQTIGPIDERASRDTQETADFIFKAGVLNERFDTRKILDLSYAKEFSK
jgi:NitT/TauT family transport system substrate-binding protein